MPSVNVTELRQRLPEHLKWVQRGEEIAVTSHGKTVARIVPDRRESERETARARLDALRGTDIAGDILAPPDDGGFASIAAGVQSISYRVRNEVAMSTVTVSEKGQVVIPAEIRRQLGIAPGCQLDFSLEGNTIRVELKRRVRPSHAEDGYGMLVCTRPGRRRLADFDVAQAMRDAADDRP